MILAHAKKLHNGDEVEIKETGEIVTVSDVQAHGVSPFRVVWITAMTNDGWRTLTHREIK